MGHQQHSRIPLSDLPVLRLCVSPARHDFSEPRADLTLRRLCGLPHRQIRHAGAKGGPTVWLEFTDLAAEQIDAYVGLFRLYGVAEHAMEVA